jgi:hypothetical protein
MLLAPLPGVIAIGICAAIYMLSYASDYVAVALFSAIFMIAAWLLGFLLCLIAAGIRKARGV